MNQHTEKDKASHACIFPQYLGSVRVTKEAFLDSSRNCGCLEKARLHTCVAWEQISPVIDMVYGHENFAYFK